MLSCDEGLKADENWMSAVLVVSKVLVLVPVAPILADITGEVRRVLVLRCSANGTVVR